MRGYIIFLKEKVGRRTMILPEPINSTIIAKII
jgi:hypothetical protein